MPKIVIDAETAEKTYWRDLWNARQIFFFLAARDLLVRYKQAAIGVLWAVLRPVLTMMILTLVFGRFAGLPSHGAPYTVLVVAALLPWQFFSIAFAESSESLVQNSKLIEKIYFHRMTIPLSAIAACFPDFVISFLLLIGVLAFYSIPVSFKIFAIVGFLGLLLAITIGLSLFISSLNVKYRDFRYVVPFIIQLAFLGSPIAYSSDLVPEKFRLFYALNPIVGVVDGFRWAVIPGLDFPALTIGVGALVSAVILILGIYFFRKTERYFADVI